MGNKEYSVGERFVNVCGEFVCILDDGYGCSGCAGLDYNDCNYILGECNKNYRTDGNNVKFIKITNSNKKH